MTLEFSHSKLHRRRMNELTHRHFEYQKIIVKNHDDRSLVMILSILKSYQRKKILFDDRLENDQLIHLSYLKCFSYIQNEKIKYSWRLDDI